MFARAERLRKGLEEMVAALDVDVLEAGAAARLMDQFAAMEHQCATAKALCAMRAAEGGAWRREGERSPAHWMARRAGMSFGQAVDAIETVRRAEHLPRTDAAMRAGKLSPAQASEITSAAAADPTAERELLRAAATEGLVGLKERCQKVRAAASGADELSRHRAIHRNRHFRHWSDVDGAFRADIRGTADAGARLLAALQPHLERVFVDARTIGVREPHEAYAFDALLAAVTKGSGKPAGKVTVLVDHAALIRGHTRPGERCEIAGVGPVPVATAEAMMGDAFLAAVVTDGVDVKAVAHLGRAVTARQRTALEARGQSCAVPGCGVTHHLEIDHVTGWAHTKVTALDDLEWLCGFHHHQKTYGGAELRGPPGNRTWIPPPTDENNDALGQLEEALVLARRAK